MLRSIIKLNNNIINKIQGRILVFYRQTAEKTVGLFTSSLFNLKNNVKDQSLPTETAANFPLILIAS